MRTCYPIYDALLVPENTTVKEAANLLAALRTIRFDVTSLCTTAGISGLIQVQTKICPAAASRPNTARP
jgi:hypothetical protein